jgi:hypothetical protein
VCGRLRTEGLVVAAQCSGQREGWVEMAICAAALPPLRAGATGLSSCTFVSDDLRRVVHGGLNSFFYNNMWHVVSLFCLFGVLDCSVVHEKAVKERGSIARRRISVFDSNL